MHIVRTTLDDNRPIFLQIREMIEEDIVEGILKEGEKAPSTNQLVAYYKINPSTVLKGVNELVDEGILYKKRGVGMFVAEGSRQKLVKQRKQNFKDEYILRMIQEAEKLDITLTEIHDMIRECKGGE